MPKTADEAYRRSQRIPQPGGGVVVMAPEIPFTVRGIRGVTGFQALIRDRKPVFYQMTSLGAVEELASYEVPRAQMEEFRREGATLAIPDSTVKVRFPPPYIDGFLRRVDEEAKHR